MTISGVCSPVAWVNARLTDLGSCRLACSARFPLIWLAKAAAPGAKIKKSTLGNMLLSAYHFPNAAKGSVMKYNAVKIIAMTDRIARP